MITKEKIFITFSQCCGTGKTRTIKNFLDILLSDQYRVEFQESEIDFFENTINIYFNFDQFNSFREETNSFNHAFYYFLFGQLFKKIGIKMSSTKKLHQYTQWLHADSFLRTIKNLFISKDEKTIRFWNI